MPELFIGITSWNDAEFLRRSLPAWQRSLAGVDARIVVCDNGSTDDSARVAESCGATCVVQPSRQSDALNLLLGMSDAPYLLLVHSDVFPLHPQWFPIVRDAMRRNGDALISPEDIGLGNYLRKAFVGMPESSFLFFDTDKALACRDVRFSTQWLTTIYLRHGHKFRQLHPLRRLDLYAPHVTHRLADVLYRHGYTWSMMRPLPSQRLATPWYRHPDYDVAGNDLFYYDYGFGNFYHFEGVITHFHTWYARMGNLPDGDLNLSEGFRQACQAYCLQAQARFLRDQDAGTVRMPRLDDGVDRRDGDDTRPNAREGRTSLPKS